VRKTSDGFKKVTYSPACRSYAPRLLENQYDILIVREPVGHKDERTTQIYARVVQTKSIVKNPLVVF
jgi:site-specific recombinase XerD